ncbi:hypothetical protein BD289DRAFT_485718 [Coniella lustricola]|uniref:Inactive metallocarboxypeptidase ECM14 n=1 Tax=Coniella lustricola TaxID=2025994 RepID=A0A2T2ZXP3_9PEZI|nr:hypothetical protein BD289DRAFT_485718 [Coniella lustricola]
MWRSSPFLVPLLLVVLASPFSVLVSANANHGAHHNHPHPARPALSSYSSSVFPYLTWLRDNAVRLVFGAQSPKDSIDVRPASIHRMFKDEIVVRFNTSNVQEERALADATERLFLDIWSWDGTIDLRVQKNKLAALLSLLPESLASAYWILVEDLAAAVYESYPAPPAERSQRHLDPKFSPDSPLLSTSTLPGDGDEGFYFFRNYQPHKVVLRWMRLTEAMFPSFVRFTTIGQSYEGRDIPALIISGSNAAAAAASADDQSSSSSKQPRKTLVIMGGSHAREWISTTTVNYLAWSFITAYGKDRLITKFLQAYDIVFIPELNPDGIEYTWTSDRLWRKSRQHTSMVFCRGLDLDHAFGYEWDAARRFTGHTNDPCSESYGGDEPWESVEVAALRDWTQEQVADHNMDFVGLIDLHAYSQQILFPYSYTCEVDPPNVEKMEELAMGLAKSIRLFSGETYSVKPACQGAVSRSSPSSSSSEEEEEEEQTQGNDRQGAKRIEPSGGSAIDWFYHELGAHFSYQIKLRDTGSYGFLLPSDYIIPTGEEILQSIRYLSDFLLGNDGIEKLEKEQNEGQGAESNEELFAVAEEYEQVLELKKRRRRR